VGLVACAGYLVLAPHVASEGDGNEFTLVLAVFGVAHPTGYPLYTLFGGAFGALLHALGAGWWYAANVWSAVGAGAAVALVHALAARLVPPSPAVGKWSRSAVALLPAGLFALHPLWLNEATLAEVHSWHVAWLAAAALVALRLVQGEAVGRRGAFAWGACCGLGLGHHGTSVFFVVPLTCAVAWAARGSRPRAPAMGLVAAGIAGALVPLSSYAWIAWRAYHPAAYQWPLLEPSFASIVDHVRGATYRKLVGGFAASEAQRALLSTTVYPLLALGGAGLAFALRGARMAGARAILLALVAGAVLQAGFIARYGVSDPGPYFLPLLVVALLGVQTAGAWVAARARHAMAPAALALFVCALAAPGWIRTAQERDARLVDIERRVRSAWRAIPYREGVVLWRNDLYVRLRGYQLLDGENPGLDVENPAMFTWPAPRRAFERRHGVDPLAGLELRGDEDLDRAAGTIAQQTHQPVVEFTDVLAATP
jgi:hypothetical protein